MASTQTSHGQLSWRRAALLGVLVGLVALAGCTTQPAPSELDHAVAKEATLQPPDVVDVTLYFRQGRGPRAYLVPVVREVPVGADLARTALELTLQGPGGDDSGMLRPAVPTTTVVRELEMDGATALVDLSGHVISDAETVGQRPEHELLALAAIANTLTEFPQISRVAVTVDGQPGGDFWGGWGLPRTLVRDESVIGPEANIPELSTLASFSRRAQEIGIPRRPRAVVSKVRIRPRATYLRVTMELVDAEGDDLLGPVPPTRARVRGDAIQVSVRARGAGELAGDQAIDDPTFRGARVDVRNTPPSVSVSLRPNRRTAFALRSLTDPTRVVLDIRR